MIFIECKICGQMIGPLTGTAPAHYKEVDPDRLGWANTDKGWTCWDCNDSDDKSRQLELL